MNKLIAKKATKYLEQILKAKISITEDKEVEEVRGYKVQEVMASEGWKYIESHIINEINDLCAMLTNIKTEDVVLPQAQHIKNPEGYTQGRIAGFFWLLESIGVTLRSVCKVQSKVRSTKKVTNYLRGFIDAIQSIPTEGKRWVTIKNRIVRED